LGSEFLDPRNKGFGLGALQVRGAAVGRGKLKRFLEELSVLLVEAVQFGLFAKE
jgi:hypothetical protein